MLWCGPGPQVLPKISIDFEKKTNPVGCRCYVVDG